MKMLVLALLMVGCGYDYEKFATDYSDVACLKLDECNMLDFYGGTYDTCVDRWTALTGGVEDDAGDSCPNYDSSAARDCVDEWETVTCAQIEDGQTPAACDTVCSAGTQAD